MSLCFMEHPVSRQSSSHMAVEKIPLVKLNQEKKRLVCYINELKTGCQKALPLLAQKQQQVRESECL